MKDILKNLCNKPTRIRLGLASAAIGSSVIYPSSPTLTGQIRWTAYWYQCADHASRQFTERPVSLPVLAHRAAVPLCVVAVTARQPARPGAAVCSAILAEPSACPSRRFGQQRGTTSLVLATIWAISCAVAKGTSCSARCVSLPCANNALWGESDVNH